MIKQLYQREAKTNGTIIAILEEEGGRRANCWYIKCLKKIKNKITSWNVRKKKKKTKAMHLIEVSSCGIHWKYKGIWVEFR